MTPARPASAAPVTVTVVIPVKDDARELARCLDALARQTRRPEEIIVVDNRSTDDSASVAARAGATVVRCDEPGIPAASAHGYDLASGTLILRLDADCLPGPAWVQGVVDAFARRPDVSAFTGRARFVDGPAALRRPLATAYLAAYALVVSAALGHLPLFGSNAAMRRDAWRRVRADVHRCDARLHDDIDLAFHLGERHRIGYLPDADMGISMRPFESGPGFVRRVASGFRTVAVHWPHDFPPLRWNRRVIRALAGRGRGRTR